MEDGQEDVGSRLCRSGLSVLDHPEQHVADIEEDLISKHNKDKQAVETVVLIAIVEDGDDGCRDEDLHEEGYRAVQWRTHVPAGR